MSCLSKGPLVACNPVRQAPSNIGRHVVEATPSPSPVPGCAISELGGRANGCGSVAERAAVAAEKRGRAAAASSPEGPEGGGGNGKGEDRSSSNECLV